MHGEKTRKNKRQGGNTQWDYDIFWEPGIVYPMYHFIYHVFIILGFTQVSFMYHLFITYSLIAFGGIIVCCV